MVRDFKEFALKGNVLELAVAFILGAAFTTVVNSFVNDVLMNLIAAIGGRPDFSGLTFTIGDGVIGYGNFLTAATTFLLIALVLFAIVNAVRRALPAKVTQRDCPHCLSRIPIGAGTCGFCTRDVPAG